MQEHKKKPPYKPCSVKRGSNKSPKSINLGQPAQFFYNVFKALVLQSLKKQGLFGKGLIMTCGNLLDIRCPGDELNDLLGQHGAHIRCIDLGNSPEALLMANQELKKEIHVVLM